MLNTNELNTTLGQRWEKVSAHSALSKVQYINSKAQTNYHIWYSDIL